MLTYLTTLALYSMHSGLTLGAQALTVRKGGQTNPRMNPNDSQERFLPRSFQHRPIHPISRWDRPIKAITSAAKPGLPQAAAGRLGTSGMRVSAPGVCSPPTR